MDNNAYLLVAGGDAILIDAANDDDRLLALIDSRSLSSIATTHRHGDHIQALAGRGRGHRGAAGRGQPDVESIERDAGVSSVVGVVGRRHRAHSVTPRSR